MCTHELEFKISQDAERRWVEEGNGVTMMFLVHDWVAWRVILRPLLVTQPHAPPRALPYA